EQAFDAALLQEFSQAVKQRRLAHAGFGREHDQAFPGMNTIDQACQRLIVLPASADQRCISNQAERLPPKPPEIGVHKRKDTLCRRFANPRKWGYGLFRWPVP